MAWPTTYIAVDWGTTNRRAFRIENGRCAERFEDDQGILSVAPDAFPSSVSQIRDRLGDHQLLMAGMIGSNRGWITAPYVPCPADMAALAAGLVWPEERSAIVPGVSLTTQDRADVMRGEEVQLLGAVAGGMVPGTATVCHPGTHNKWAVLTDGRITSFRTVMTGEMFSLLKNDGILANLLQSPVAVGPAFAAGVRRGLEGDALTAELFAVRAKVLLELELASDAASFTSGLLIGTDVRTGLADAGGRPIMILGRPELTALYAAALGAAGQDCQEVDGEAAFLHGMAQIAERLQ